MADTAGPRETSDNQPGRQCAGTGEPPLQAESRGCTWRPWKSEWCPGELGRACYQYQRRPSDLPECGGWRQGSGFRTLLPSSKVPNGSAWLLPKFGCQGHRAPAHTGNIDTICIMNATLQEGTVHDAAWEIALDRCTPRLLCVTSLGTGPPTIRLPPTRPSPASIANTHIPRFLAPQGCSSDCVSLSARASKTPDLGVVRHVHRQTCVGSTIPSVSRRFSLATTCTKACG